MGDMRTCLTVKSTMEDQVCLVLLTHSLMPEKEREGEKDRHRVWGGLTGLAAFLNESMKIYY